MHLADVWESVAAAIPDAPAVIQGDGILSWRDYELRAAKFAAVLAVHGMGQGTHVGLLMYNCPEYLEAQFGTFKARGVPINLNYRYLGDELVYVLDNADAEALVYHASLADRARYAAARLPKVRLLIEVDDRGISGITDTATVGAIDYETALADALAQAPIERSESDLYMLYTGGTTGMPKGVMYDVGDVTQAFLHSGSTLYRSRTHREPIEQPSDAATGAVAMHEQGRERTTFACPPLMHGAGMWIGAITPHLFGAPVVLAAERSFDGEGFMHTVARHRVKVAVIVGDAFGRPIADAIDRRQSRNEEVDLNSLAIIASSGAILSDAVKGRLLEHLPGVKILDMLGSSEGGMGTKVARRQDDPATARFRPNPGVRVLRDNGTEVTAGSGEVGTVAVSGMMVPRGYYNDAVRSRHTFRMVDGVRYSFPGDMAVVETDGSIRLLGRGNSCINTGGEKVYPEEVEHALLAHPGVADCLVFGVDDARLGQRVVAVFQMVADREHVADDDIVATVRSRLAAYKAPRELRRVSQVPRIPSGKGDYSEARRLFLEGASVQQSDGEPVPTLVAPDGG